MLAKNTIFSALASLTWITGIIKIQKKYRFCNTIWLDEWGSWELVLLLHSYMLAKSKSLVLTFNSFGWLKYCHYVGRRAFLFWCEHHSRICAWSVSAVLWITCQLRLIWRVTNNPPRESQRPTTVIQGYPHPRLGNSLVYVLWGSTG